MSVWASVGKERRELEKGKYQLQTNKKLERDAREIHSWARASFAYSFVFAMSHKGKAYDSKAGCEHANRLLIPKSCRWPVPNTAFMIFSFLFHRSLIGKEENRQ